MGLRGVIFDWGGVLMRTEDYTPRLKWDRQLGLPDGTVESVVHSIEAWRQAQRGEITPSAYWQAVGRELGLTPANLAELRRDFYRGDRLDNALVALIHDLRGTGVLVGLLSNYTSDLEGILAAHSLIDLFDARVISAEIGAMKPDPATYHAILDRLNVLPEHAILVDDSERNVEGARAVGMRAIHFRPGMDLRAELGRWLYGQR